MTKKQKTFQINTKDITKMHIFVSCGLAFKRGIR